MKKECIFNPLDVFGNRTAVSDIEGLKILEPVGARLCRHPQIIPQIEVMKTEDITYQALAESSHQVIRGKIRRSVEGHHDMSDWWKANFAKRPAFTHVLHVAACSAHQLLPT